jgi:hypothetical protein
LNRNASRRDEGEKMKKRLAIAVLVLVPFAASAQVPVRGTGGAGGIVVMGRGVVRTPVIASDGRVLARKYGSHAYDQWSVDEILEFPATLSLAASRGLEAASQVP